MKKLLYLLVLLPSISFSSGVCGSGTLTTTYNAFTGKQDYVCVGGSGGNPFDQSLNTTDAVRFVNIDLLGRIYTDSLFSHMDNNIYLYNNGAGQIHFGDHGEAYSGTDIVIDSVQNTINMASGANATVFFYKAIAVSTVTANSFVGYGSGNTGVMPGNRFYLFNNGGGVNSYFLFDTTSLCLYVNDTIQNCYSTVENLILAEDGTIVLAEDGTYLLIE